MIFGFGGFITGLGLGVAVVALLEVQDTALRTERDVEAVLNLPTLALIPEISVLKTADNSGSKWIDVQRPTEPVNPSVGI
jgi:hypothetical protein